ncbi:MAG: cation:proton antiporter [Candidatus Methylomirabilales bacterium]
MSAETTYFVPLLGISAVAFAAPIMRRRLLTIVPVAVIEIVTGILLGRSGLQVIQVTPEVRFLALFGFAYLMFLSGLEVDLRLFTATAGQTEGRVRRVVSHPFYASIVLCGLTLLSALAFAFYMTRLGLSKDPWLMTLILSTTSLGVVVPTLKERYLTDTPIGQTILLTAAVKDFVTILLIAVYATLVSTGLSLKITSVLFLVIAFVVALRASTVLQRIPFLHRLFEDLADVVSQLHVRGSLLLLFIFAAFAELLGVEVILGAFVAGVVVSSLSQERGSEIRTKLDTIGYGFVLSFFFVAVGANFNLAALRSSPEMLTAMVVLLVGCYAVKVLPTLVLLVAYPWRNAVGAGVLLSARLSFILAVAAVALNLGIIGEAMQSAIVLIVITTCSTAPVIFNWLVPSPQAVERSLTR